VELRLPTIAVPVRLALVGHEADSAELFLSDVPRRDRGHLVDDLAQVLDDPAGFLPVRVGGGVRLLGKHAICWISIDVAAPRPSPDFPEEPSEVFTLYDRQHRVEIELIAGMRLTGTILSSSPADRPRVIDHLNRAVQFVRLWTPENHFVINKTQIIGVTELTESAPS
jgi:hypothetical protein